MLDVGSGTGLLAEHVAGIVGPSGQVEAVDPLPLRIEIAKRKLRLRSQFDRAWGAAFEQRGVSADALSIEKDKRTPR